MFVAGCLWRRLVLGVALLSAGCGLGGGSDESACAALGCTDKGACVSRQGTAKCLCELGYAGEHCERCARGYEQGEAGACVEASLGQCGAGTSLVGGACVASGAAVRCGAGTVLVAGECLPEGAAPIPADTKFHFGRPPSAPGAANRWQPFAEQLGRLAGIDVTMESPATYAEFLRGLTAGHYELANAAPFAAIQVQDKYEPVIHLERRKKASYRGILFVLRQSGISSLADLKGKTLALVAEDSTSGGVYPVAELRKVGLELETDVRLLWTGSHAAVAQAVRAGKADAGACYDDCREVIWKDAKAREEETRIIGLTDDIPSEMVLMRRDLAPREKQALRKALMSVQAWGILRDLHSSDEMPITGISAASENELRSFAKTLKGIPEALARARQLAEQRKGTAKPSEQPTLNSGHNAATAGER